MRKILSLLSFLMLAVVAMAADLTTGVTFKGTWGDKLGAFGTAEGEMKVTKVEGGLKFEVKSNAFKGYAFPDYTVVYTCEVGADGSFNAGGFSRGEITGDATVEGTAVSSMYWQQIKGTVTNESIDLYMRYCGANMEELGHVTFTGTAVAGETPSTPEPKAYKNVLNIVRVNDAKISYPNAEVLVLDKGEGKYAVTLPEFTDLDGNDDNCVGKLTFEANGVEEEGKIKLTANNVVTGKPEGGSVDWTDATYSVEMDATIEGETIVGKITLKLVDGDPADGYEYTLTFGEEEETPQPTAQNFSENWESTAGGTGNTTVEILTYEDGKVTMSTKVEDCDVKADNLTQGTDDKGRVTYTGKAKNLVNNVEYDVNAVVYGEATQPRIYMTLTTEWKFVYTIGENPDKPDPNEVVATKTYTDNLTVGHDAQTGEVTGYADKQVVFTKYANGESSVTFKEYPISETETRDLTFRGVIQEYDMSDERADAGTMTFGEDMVMTPIEDETSAFFGKEISLMINISSYSADKMEFTYEFGSEDGIYYIGQYGVEIEQPETQNFIENWKSTSASGEKATVEIATASDGKVSMTVNVDDRTITADDLTQGKDEKDRVTYTGKAVDSDMNEYDVKAVVYGAEDLQRIYMTLTNGEFVYTIGEDPDITNGINGVETEMENGNVSIYTVGGAKLNTLHKGINIVRLANGKTIKVIK